MSMNREQSFAIPTKEEWMAALTMRHGEERQKAFSAATVAVCGLGGLGSNIATALARAGISKLILMDFDCVDMPLRRTQSAQPDKKPFRLPRNRILCTDKRLLRE